MFMCLQVPTNTKQTTQTKRKTKRRKTPHKEKIKNYTILKKIYVHIQRAIGLRQMVMDVQHHPPGHTEKRFTKAYIQLE